MKGVNSLFLSKMINYFQRTERYLIFLNEISRREKLCVDVLNLVVRPNTVNASDGIRLAVMNVPVLAVKINH